MSAPISKLNPFVGLLIAVAAWAVPGLGHLLLRRWSRGLVFFVTVGTLALTGVALRGRIFSPGTGDFFDLVGFLADCGAGGFFLLTKWIENGGADVSRAAGDYGTRFFATAGVLNLLCVLDAYHLAVSGKE